MAKGGIDNKNAAGYPHATLSGSLAGLPLGFLCCQGVLAAGQWPYFGHLFDLLYLIFTYHLFDLLFI